MSQVKTLFFATLRDRAGVGFVNLQIPAQTSVAEFKSILTQQFPALKDYMGHVLISINQEYAFEETIIPDDAEVALFPPVSGG
jgi:molybdopterin converting factor subunit 1